MPLEKYFLKGIPLVVKKLERKLRRAHNRINVLIVKRSIVELCTAGSIVKYRAINAIDYHWQVTRPILWFKETHFRKGAFH